MFGLMILEWPFVTMAAAFLASIGFFNIFLVAFLGWMGDTVWDIIFFCIGRFWLKIFSRKKIINEEKKENLLSKINILIEKNFLLSLVFIKFTPYAPMIVLPYLGSLKQISTFKFIIATTTLSLPVPLCVAIIGYHITSIQIAINTIPENYRIPIIILLVILLILFAIGLFFLFKKSRKIFLKKIDSYIENSQK